MPEGYTQNSSEYSRLPEVGQEVPVDYKQLVASSNSVVMLGESHLYEGVFRDMAAHATDLKAGGLSVLLLEAPDDQDFSAVNQGDFSRIDELVLGPTITRNLWASMVGAVGFEVAEHGDGIAEARKQLITACVSAGIRVEPIDDHRHWRGEELEGYEGGLEREATLAQHIVAHEDALHPGEKVGVLIGRAHTRRGVHYYGEDPELPFKEVGQLIEDADIPQTTIHFTNLEPTRPQQVDIPPTELAAFMVRPANSGRADPNTQPDWRVNIPPTDQERRIAAIRAARKRS